MGRWVRMVLAGLTLHGSNGDRPPSLWRATSRKGYWAYSHYSHQQTKWEKWGKTFPLSSMQTHTCSDQTGSSRLCIRTFEWDGFSRPFAVPVGPEDMRPNALTNLGVYTLCHPILEFRGSAFSMNFASMRSFNTIQEKRRGRLRSRLGSRLWEDDASF